MLTIHQAGVTYECPVCLKTTPRKENYIRHYNALHQANLIQGRPPPPVVLNETIDLNEKYTPKGPVNKIKKSTKIIPSHAATILTDPRLDPTSRSKLSNRSAPYCPPSRKGMLIPFEQANRPETFIPNISDSPVKFSPGKTLVKKTDELAIPSTSNTIELIMPNIPEKPYSPPIPNQEVMNELTVLLSEIAEEESKYAYQQPQVIHNDNTPLTLCNQEYTMETLFGSTTPVQDESNSTKTPQIATTQIPIDNTTNERSDIPSNEIPKTTRDLNFSDYLDFLDIAPTPSTNTLNNRRPTCVVVGYPIAIRYPEELNNLTNPEVDLERLFNSIA